MIKLKMNVLHCHSTISIELDKLNMEKVSSLLNGVNLKMKEDGAVKYANEITEDAF